MKLSNIVSYNPTDLIQQAEGNSVDVEFKQSYLYGIVKMSRLTEMY